MSTQAKVKAALEHYDNVARSGLGTSTAEDLLADALRAVLSERSEAVIGVNRPVIEGAVHAQLLADHYREHAPHWAYLCGDSDYAMFSRRVADAVVQMVTGLVPASKNDVVVNPVLRDALVYRNERRTMNNPKDWAHVGRKVREAVSKGVYVGVATPAQIETAIAVLDELVKAEENGQAS